MRNRRPSSSVPTAIVAAVIALLSLVTSGCQEPPPPPPPDPAEVVARVGGTEITRGEVEQLILSEVARSREREATDAIRRGALETVVGNVLMVRAAEARGMAVPAERLAEDLEGVRSQFARDEQFQAYLERNGLTEDELETKTRHRLLAAAYADAIVGDPTPDEATLREIYEARRDTLMKPEALHARQILARVKRKGDPDENHRVARGNADTARRRLLDGDDWKAVAAELSTGPNKLNAGDMGWFERGRWMPEWEEVVYALPDGELSEVFQTQLGYHVVQILERRLPQPQSFEEARNGLTLAVTRERRDAALESHLRELLDASDLEILDDELRRAMEAGDG